MSDDIIRKISALMAKANGTENEHEAAAFAAKAHEMLAAHNLSMLDILKHGAAQKGEGVARSECLDKSVNGWHTELMSGVAAYYFCKVLIQTYWDGAVQRKKFLVIGKPHNASVAISMYEYLKKTSLRLAREWMKREVGTRSEQLHFEKACGVRLAQRLRQLKAAEQAKPATGGGGLPALYNNEIAACEEFIAKEMKVRKGKPAKMSMTGRGAHAGREAAERVGLNTQVQQGSALRAIR